jgi:serine/threonine-protein kinase
MMQATRPVPPLTDLRPDLESHPTLLAAVAKACAKEAAARQQTAGALREELAAALGPAFMIPPGATPAPLGSGASLSPAPPPGPANWDRPTGPGEQPAISRRIASAAVEAARGTFASVRRNPRAFAAAAVALAFLAALAGAGAWRHGRAAKQARSLLASNHAGEARAVLDDALEHRPEDPELLLLRAHALHKVAGRTGDAIEAYAAARARGPLDAEALENLVGDLGRERSLADRAAKLLREDAARALPGVLRAASTATGAHRLRALALARDLGAEDQIDRVQAYAGLLADPDCETRRAAARRLGELGDPAALLALRRAAQAKTELKGTGFFSKPKQVPACGAPDADAAARRIEASRLPDPSAPPSPVPSPSP